ncbi:MAG TPA: helix-turn-helix transcriptional regulator [candidate division Zixibacteria bacterium]|nr:helix-turn-helix transcriptional regulator [candidate division Zixibacteria bacterium]
MTEAKLREVHEATGVPMPTLAKIRYGVTADPRGSTLDKIRAYLRCHPPISEAA